MKSTGMTRPVDNLGRVVIPKELRKVMNINESDRVEIFTEGKDIIVLRKYNPGCTFCGSMDKLFIFGGKHVCGDCGNMIRKYLKGK